MQKAVPPGQGAMVALVQPTSLKDILQVLETMEGVVEIANVNSDKQVVISGEKEAVSKAATMCRSQGVCRRSVSLRIFILT